MGDSDLRFRGEVRTGISYRESLARGHNQSRNYEWHCGKERKSGQLVSGVSGKGCVFTSLSHAGQVL